MARGKSRNRTGNRDHTSITSSLVFRPTLSRTTLAVPSLDRRLYDPDPYVARTFSNKPARITVAPPAARQARPGRGLAKLLFPSREQHVFSAPSRVMICVRRQVRREVLHALKLKRSGRGKSKRRNYHSNIRC